MSFIVESELIKDMQAADAMAAGQDFSAVQTSAGYAVFFAQDPDGKFHATRETSDDQANALGWQKVDLTPANGNATLTNFAIAQNPETLNFDIVAAGIANGKHNLWIAQNQTTDIFSSFKDGAITWQERPPPTDLAIAKLYIMDLFQGTKKIQMIYADVFRRPQEHSQLIDRYYINPVEQPYWFPRSMGADFFANSMRTCVGRPAGELNAGVYTFGIVNTFQQLTYQPSMLGRVSGHSPNISRFIAPPNSYSIASAPAQDGASTNLFVAAQDGLYLFKPENQHDGAVPAKILDASETVLSKILFEGIRKMTARWMGDRIVLFLLNAKQQLLYTSCKRSDVERPKEWKLPISICSQVQNYTFFIDTEASKVSSKFGNVLFVQRTNKKLTMLSQNLSTGIWETSPILLPSKQVDKVYERTTFTSQVRLVDANNANQPNTVVNIKALSYTTAFIDGVSYFLEPGVAVPITTGADGTLSIVQDAVGLAAAGFTLTVASGGTTVTVDPTQKAYKNLGDAKTKDGIKKITYKNAQGKDVPLVPTGSDNDTLAQSMSRNIQSILDARAAFQSGTQPSSSSDSRVRRGFWDWDLDVGDLIQYVSEGFEEVVDGVVSAVEAATDFVVSTAGGVWNVVVNIGQQTYGAILDSLEAVGEAVIGVFEKVKATVEDLIDWLGFLFDWGDIMRTHDFIHKMLTMYTKDVNSRIGSLISQCDSTIDSIIAKARDFLNSASTININNMNTTGLTKKVGAVAAPTEKLKAADTPQASWGARMLQKHGSDATAVKQPPLMAASTQFDTLLKAVTDSSPSSTVQDTITAKVQSLFDDVAKKVSGMDPWAAVKSAFSICLDLLEQFGKSLIRATLGFINFILKSIFDLLQVDMNVPVLSYVWTTYIKKGTPMSMMNVTALLLAVPVTVVYKATLKIPLFSDTDNALYKIANDAADWTAFKTAINAAKHPKTRIPNTYVSRTFAQLANILGFAGSVILTLLVRLFSKDMYVAEYKGPIAWTGIGGWIAFVMPNITSLFEDATSGLNLWNDFITLTAVAKAAVDFGLPAAKGEVWMLGPGKSWTNWISPGLDIIINGAWLIVLSISYHTSEHTEIPSFDAIMLAGNICFDISGLITWIRSPVILNKLPEGKREAVELSVKATESTLDLLYGVLCIVGVINLEEQT